MSESPGSRDFSLRTRLLVGMLSIVAVVWLLSAFASYAQARRELGELLDAHLATSAALLVAQASEELEEIELEHLPDLGDAHQRLALQVWSDGRLGVHSANAPNAPLAPFRHGFADVTADGTAWRVYSTRSREGDWVQVGEPVSARTDILREALASQAWPMLLALPLLGVGIWLVLGRGLSSLQRMAQAVGTRAPLDTTPIMAADAPREIRPHPPLSEPMPRRHAPTGQPRIPDAPRSIQKGSSLGDLLDQEAVDCLAHNLSLVYPQFDSERFRHAALTDLAPLAVMQRGQHLARALRAHLPSTYDEAVDILLRSLTPPLSGTEGFGLAVFFYLPHVSFVATYGLDPAHNDGRDPFETSMRAQYELTRRFSAEFSIRPFLIASPERTLARLQEWTRDSDPHVRRLCSEGTRPRLPWAMRIPAFIRDPRPVLPILEALKDDDELYVRRSVANHLGDIAKDHAELVFELCERWLDDASADRKWLIRHALRHPAKKGVKAALSLRKAAT